MLKIRRISTAEKQIRAWQQCYQADIALCFSKENKLYFQLTLVSDIQKIQALVPVECWCHHHWPNLSHYAWDRLDNESFCELFTTEINGKRFFSDHFRCEYVEIVDDSVINSACLIIQEPTLGEVRFFELIEGLEKKTYQNKILENLTLQADWILGYSQISFKLLQSIELHDVLYIQKLQLNMSIAGRLFANFQKQEEGLFMIDELITSKTEEMLLSTEEGYIQEPIQPFNINNMNIQLTFVLGHNEIPVSEISNIQPGSIYSIGENKEREVKVYANKQLIAEGELIYIGDSEELGLEITRLVNLGDRRV
ncbi:FliM/FliN family flagellar motor switch protein [Providencia heimbachae]|uniref:Uncharacterized protein n=2 Tax=Providencia heimbachae TaxID=333962 RepID=A0A1B7JTZ3_9GAMM|nr:FliM/FliN family flagellar motor switch protein [Providencia heimbachae]OAT51377.1 hypothetical protein M998_2314 [Providencia heimbachae ATCC 35613]SQH11541.1 type III secretion system protein SpaO [Providencia heimbachae]